MGTKLNHSQRGAMREWIRRLRAGDRAQGRASLHVEAGGVHKYCCLGIAAELAAEQRVIEPGQNAGSVPGQKIQGIVHSYDGSISTMTQRLRQFVGIDAMTVNRLIYLNDIKTLTFREIADFLEREFLSDDSTSRTAGPARHHPAEGARPRSA